ELGEKEPTETPFSTDGSEVVFIDHSHDRESFLPLLPDESEPNRAHNSEVNITKVSDGLAGSLEPYGIGTSVDDTDIMNILNENDWNYGQSYQASRPVVQEVMNQNEDLQYIIDVHRDALPRDRSTTEINGEAYAQILFVVGAENN